MSSLNDVRFFATAPHDCSYLDDRKATTLFADPDIKIQDEEYQQLTLIGFRRSGRYFYRPQCENCASCISIRVPTAEFKLSRRFKRTLKKTASISMETKLPYIDDEIYDLYSRYINVRHRDGDMFPPSAEQFRTFLMIEGPQTQFVCYRDDEQKLVAVSVTDILPGHGMSAVYTFFDPELDHLSLGQMAILRQIGWCQQEQLPYLYLGYWIRECQKMNYKTEYEPTEMLIGRQWARLQRTTKPNRPTGT